MSYTKTTWTKGDVITAEKLNKIESGIEQAGSGGSGEFDFKAFCQEWVTLEDEGAALQAMNKVPQNIFIHCSGTPGSGTIVADEDYGDYFEHVLTNLLSFGGRSVTLVNDMTYEGVTLRTYIGPLYRDANFGSSSPTYYNLMANSNQLASAIFTQDGREFTQEGIKFLVWEEEEHLV